MFNKLKITDKVKSKGEAMLAHGSEIFGSRSNFSLWLISKNFYFDKKMPLEFLKSEEGIDLIENTLTNLEYGNNT